MVDIIDHPGHPVYDLDKILRGPLTNSILSIFAIIFWLPPPPHIHSVTTNGDVKIRGSIL